MNSLRDHRDGGSDLPPGEVERPGATGNRFLWRTTWAVVVTGGLASLAVGLRWGNASGLAFAVGLAWGLANFWTLAHLLRATTHPDGADKPRVVLFATVKFLVYGAGIALLTIDRLPALALVAGFTWLLTVVFLRALGAWITDRSDPALPAKATERRV